MGRKLYSLFIMDLNDKIPEGAGPGDVELDFDREARCGFPEFIYGAGKSLEQLLVIVPEMVERTGAVLVTRLPLPDHSVWVDGRGRRFHVRRGEGVSKLYPDFPPDFRKREWL